MKNKYITQKIIDEYTKVKKYPSSEIWEKLENSISVSETTTQNKKMRKLLMKPAFVFAICTILIITVAATTPLILKMLGSEIGFFDTNKETRYSPYQEMLKQYSTQVNITQEQNGISFTIDNIAVDDNFINIFYTIKSEYNLYEYIQNWYVERDGGKKIDSRWYINPKFHDFTLYQFTPMLDYKLPGIDGRNSGNRNNFDSLDSYAVSDYEIKGAQKMLISEELPEIFTLELSVINYDFFSNLDFVNIPLTIDRTATSIITTNIYPAVNAILTGKHYGNDTLVAHNITVEKVSMSPLGNVIVFSEETEHEELFWDYILMDDKDNYLERNRNGQRYRAWTPNDEENIARFADEIYGINENTEYLKLIPFTKVTDYTWEYDVTKTENGEYYSDLFNAYADKDNLPAKLRHTNKTVLNIETIEAINDTVTITYTIEGVAGYDNMNFAFWLVYYDNAEFISTSQMMRNHYDIETKKYTQTIILPGFDGDISTLVKGVSVQYSEIKILEDEAIIIPLK